MAFGVVLAAFGYWEVLLALEVRRQAEEEEHLRLKSQEEARIAEEASVEA